MKIRRFSGSFLLFALGLCVGCASDPVDVSTTFDPLTPFPARATYLWDEAANELPDDPRVRGISVRPHELSSYGILSIEEVCDEELG